MHIIMFYINIAVYTSSTADCAMILASEM